MLKAESFLDDKTRLEEIYCDKILHGISLLNKNFTFALPRHE